MAHFAKLGKGNIVEKVEVVSNDIATTEQAGVDFLKELYKEPYAVWKQTSYNNNIRNLEYDTVFQLGYEHANLGISSICISPFTNEFKSNEIQQQGNLS